MANQPLYYGLIGAGAFGRFCIEQYRSLPGLRIAAVADVNTDAARDLAGHFAHGPDPLDITAHGDVEALLADERLDIVHIATPPFTHADLAARALAAGRHVLCEKPLATTIDDGRRLAGLAAEHGRVLSVNLIMRYNPLAEAVRAIRERRLLGEPLHGYFENYAKDEPLGPGHWFWQREKSGGIFIEHGVHFFDLFAYWLSEPAAVSQRAWVQPESPRVVAAQQVRRPGNPAIVEQQQCAVRYPVTTFDTLPDNQPPKPRRSPALGVKPGVGAPAGDPRPCDVLVNFHHGFTQAERMDRQEMRLLFERGDVRLHEWVPTRIEIDGLMTHDTRDAIAALLHEPAIETLDEASGERRSVTSRHKGYTIDGRYRLSASVGVDGQALDKPALYGHVLRGLLSDQLDAIRALERGDHHDRRITAANGLSSLELAAHAQQLAEG